MGLNYISWSNCIVRNIWYLIIMIFVVACNSGGSISSSEQINKRSNPRLQDIRDDPDFNYHIMLAEANPGHKGLGEIEDCKYSTINNNECSNTSYIYNDDMYSIITTKAGRLYAGTNTGYVIHMTHPLDKTAKGLKKVLFADNAKVNKMVFDDDSGVLLVSSSDNNSLIKAYNADLSESVQIRLPAAHSELKNIFNVSINGQRVFLLLFNRSDVGGYVAWISPDELFKDGKIADSYVIRHIPYNPIMGIATPPDVVFESNKLIMKNTSNIKPLKHYYMTGVAKGTYIVSADSKSLFFVSYEDENLYKISLDNLNNFGSITTFTKIANTAGVLPGMSKSWIVEFVGKIAGTGKLNFITTAVDDGSNLWLGTSYGELFQCSMVHLQYNSDFCIRNKDMTFANSVRAIVYDRNSEKLFVASGSSSDDGGALRVLDIRSNQVKKILDNSDHGIYGLALLRDPYSYPDFLSLHDFYRVTKEFSENIFNAAMKQQLLEHKNDIIYKKVNNALQPIDARSIVTNMHFVSNLPLYAESEESKINGSDLGLLPKVNYPTDPSLVSIVTAPIKSVELCSNQIIATTITNDADVNQNLSSVTSTVNLTSSQTNTSSWNIGVSASQALTYGFGAGPVFKLTGTTTVTGSYGIAHGNSITHSDSYSYTIPSQTVLVPPHKTFHVMVCVDKKEDKNGLFKVQYPYEKNSYVPGHLLINGADTNVFVDVIKLGLAYKNYCDSHPSDVDCSMSKNEDIAKRIQINKDSITMIGLTQYNSVNEVLGQIVVKDIESVTTN